MPSRLLVISLFILAGCTSTGGGNSQPAEVVDVSPPATVMPGAAGGDDSAPKVEVRELGQPAEAAATPAPEWVDVPLSPDTWWEPAGAYKEGEYEIPLAAGQALEHMISMTRGDLVVYSWSADMPDPSKLASEFHGHTLRIGAAPGTVMFYKTHKDGKESGSLRAPFTGVHGWYLKNESDQNIVVRLKLAGFYSE